MSKTLRERFIAALQSRGETEVKQTARSVVYTRKEGGYWFLGSSGSLRFGPNKTSSIPASARFKAELLA